MIARSILILTILLLGAVPGQAGTLAPRLEALLQDREETHLNDLRDVIEKEGQSRRQDAVKLTALDFQFHHLLSLASGNQIYPLLINSFKQVYLNLAAQFFEDAVVVNTVHAFHRKMLKAVENRDETFAGSVMEQMLVHGADHLQKLSHMKR